VGYRIRALCKQCAGDHDGDSWWKRAEMQLTYLTICGSSDIPCSYVLHPELMP
jgi:hypothetical protein